MAGHAPTPTRSKLRSHSLLPDTLFMGRGVAVACSVYRVSLQLTENNTENPLNPLYSSLLRATCPRPTRRSRMPRTKRKKTSRGHFYMPAQLDTTALEFSHHRLDPRGRFRADAPPKARSENGHTHRLHGLAKLKPHTAASINGNKKTMCACNWPLALGKPCSCV